MKEEHDSAKADAQHAHVIVNCISGQFELVRCSEVVGVLEFKRAGKHFDLVRTYVSPEHRGQGYARTWSSTAWTEASLHLTSNGWTIARFPFCCGEDGGLAARAVNPLQAPGRRPFASVWPS